MSFCVSMTVMVLLMMLVLCKLCMTASVWMLVLANIVVLFALGHFTVCYSVCVRGLLMLSVVTILLWAHCGFLFRSRWLRVLDSGQLGGARATPCWLVVLDSCLGLRRVDDAGCCFFYVGDIFYVGLF